MKTLYLIRHAKSEWANENLKDIDRPLNARGYNDAYKMSNWLKQNNIVPELIISSAAIRAISTALIFSRNLKYDDSKICITNNLYESGYKNYLDLIHSVNNNTKSIMIFAHNPSITELSNYLTKAFTDNIPTCGMVGLKIENDKWEDFNFQTATLFLYEFPKK